MTWHNSYARGRFLDEALRHLSVIADDCHECRLVPDWHWPWPFPPQAKEHEEQVYGVISAAILEETVVRMKSDYAKLFMEWQPMALFEWFAPKPSVRAGCATPSGVVPDGLPFSSKITGGW